MHKSFLTSIALWPLLLSFSHAAQTWAADQPESMIFSSEDSATNAYLGVDIADVTANVLAI